jgi:hypothetical protein
MSMPPSQKLSSTPSPPSQYSPERQIEPNSRLIAIYYVYLAYTHSIAIGIVIATYFQPIKEIVVYQPSSYT